MRLDPMRLALAALACYRLAQLVTIDNGPFMLLARLRAWAGTHENTVVREMIGGLVHCPFCLGLWLAAPLAVLALWPTAIGDVVLAIGGLAGVQAWMQGTRDVTEG